MIAALTLAAWIAAAPEPVQRAYEAYAAAEEVRMRAELGGSAFFAADGRERLRRGETLVESLSPPAVANGLIHHRRARAFAPRASYPQALALVEDYANYPRVYRPDIQAARVLAREGHDARVFLQIVKKKIVTATLDTEHEIRYTELDARRGYSFTRTTKAAEAGRSDRGFLWDIRSHWRFWEADGGVYIQVESISLSRDAPPGLGWIVNGFIQSVHRDFLVHLVEATRRALAGGAGN